MAVTKSFSVEFDDALLDLEGWKNPRYEGSKLTGQKINEWNEGDITYGKNPVIENKTTALYIGNTLIGGEDEDESYVHIKRHSYVGINRILIIDPLTDDVTLLDSTQEEYEPFHRFVTNDLPTGGAFNIRLLDFSIPNALDAVSKYYVKMNKGWLLKSFKYGEYTNQGIPNPIALFKDMTWSLPFGKSDKMIFQYGSKLSINQTIDFGPSYVSSSIISNKFTDQYYKGAYSFPSYNTSISGSFISASKFIGAQSMDFLENNIDITELHLTLLNGTINFAPGFNDERSIGTFEIDRNTEGIEQTSCLDGAPTYPYLTLKGQTGSNFWPTTPTKDHDIEIAGFPNSWPSFSNVHTSISGSSCNDVGVTFARNYFMCGDEYRNLGGLSYSGPFTYEISFLDKAHTLIANIPKERYLPNGIGEKGFVIIPEQTDRRVKDNIDYYLQKAGLIEKTVTAKAPRRGR